jgi:hypothetical protein
MDQMRGKTAAPEETRDDLQEILKRTSLVVFFANQLRLLEFVGLDGPSERNIENIATHLKDWSKVRCEYLKSTPGAPQECKLPPIVALNDPATCRRIHCGRGDCDRGDSGDNRSY